MFGTILGALPRPPASQDSQSTDDDLVRSLIAAQEAAGLEPITDGRLRWHGELGPLAALDGLTAGREGRVRASASPRRSGPLVLDEWRFAASATTRAVKQALPGPYTSARRIQGNAAGRQDLTLALADALHDEIDALADAGCPLVEIDEPDAAEIAAHDSERQLFIEAHRRLTRGLSGVHLSLALTGGNADTAGVEPFADAPYASYAVDVIHGPDNWRLVTRIPGDRGIVCGALDSRTGSDDAVELLVWAARYAASSAGRGLDRVGLAVVPGLDRQDWPVVVRKLSVLGRAIRLAGLTDDALAGTIDPRAVDSRSAALGRYDPPQDRPRRRR